jgi:hypothetical protein
MQTTSHLIGVWQLLSIQAEFADSGEIVDVYGARPTGFLILTDGGRMMAVVTAGDRAPPETEADRDALFENMMSYTGNYRLEGDKFITKVDVAWHPAWNGTEQPRFFQLDGEVLSLTTPRQTHPRFPGRSLRGVMTWRRAS